VSPILVGDLSVVDPVALVELPDELDHMFHAHARDGRPRGCVRVLVGGGGMGDFYIKMSGLLYRR
jgi:hypothetical protein